MTPCELKAFHNRTVSITFHDGEIATARLTCSSEHSDDVMIDILGTDRPDRYAQRETCSYIVPAAELAKVVEISPLPAGSDATPQTPAIHETLPLIEPPQLGDSPAESLAA